MKKIPCNEEICNKCRENFFKQDGEPLFELLKKLMREQMQEILATDTFTVPELAELASMQTSYMKQWGIHQRQCCPRSFSVSRKRKTVPENCDYLTEQIVSLQTLTK